MDLRAPAGEVRVDGVDRCVITSAHQKTASIDLRESTTDQDSIRRDMFGYYPIHANHRVRPDNHTLMDDSVHSKIGMIADDDRSAKGYASRGLDVAPDFAIVVHLRSSHEIAPTADPCPHSQHWLRDGDPFP
jgi:hypothetical protein